MAANESHGVCDGIRLKRSRDGVCKVFLDYGGLEVEVVSGNANTLNKYVAGYTINRLIREGLGKDSLPPLKPIVIEVRGGVVQEVRNVPPGFEYEVKDYDNEPYNEAEGMTPTEVYFNLK